jgi:hypothetical protein
MGMVTARALFWSNKPNPAIYQPPSFELDSRGILRRLRLEKLLYLGPPRSPNVFCKALLDPGGGLNSETAARRFQK